jgi:hypothetical protein
MHRYLFCFSLEHASNDCAINSICNEPETGITYVGSQFIDLFQKPKLGIDTVPLFLGSWFELQCLVWKNVLQHDKNTHYQD